MIFSRVMSMAVALACSMVGAAAEPLDYRLGPEDQLQIRVFDLRTGTGEAYKWTAFDGEYMIGASGTVSLPLLGSVEAAGHTSAELATSIGEKLQERVGLATRPDASVQVSKYRPFYVLGSVDKPGAYEYRPDLTVLQAVSLAGGIERVAGDALLGYARDALTSRGDLRVLTADRLALLARQARLDAEIQGSDTITVPAEVEARMADASVARLVREEQLLFDSRRYSLTSQIEILNQTKTLLQKQIDSFSAKDDSLSRQLDLVKKELDQVSGLVSKGLAVLPRQLDIQQSTARFESDRLDVQLSILRARQDLSKADRDILEIQNTRRNQALQEATEVRNKLVETAEKIDTDTGLIFQSEVRAPLMLAAGSSALETPNYVIVRQTNGKSVSMQVSEGDPVDPGDTLRVEPRTPQRAATVSSTDGTIQSPPVAVPVN